MIIKHNKELKTTSLQIPGWAGSSTNNSFQPWHMKQWVDAATAGVELIYPHEDITIPKVVAPFTYINDLFFLLEIDITISTPEKTNLLIIPHYRFYTDAEWSTPIPVATMLEADWWPNITILFKMPPKGYVTKFIKNEPFAQAIVVPRNLLELEKMTDKEMERNETAKLYTKGVQNLATRNWVTSSGFIQNNLYEVLSAMEQRNQLPEQLKPKKKYRVILNDMV